MFQFANLLKKGMILAIINKILMSISKINVNFNINFKNQQSKFLIVNQNYFSSVITAVASNHKIALIGNNFKCYSFTFTAFHKGNDC